MNKWIVPALLLTLSAALPWPGSRVAAQTGSVTVLAAGDFADDFDMNLSNAFATAALVAQFPGDPVITLGDYAYDESTEPEMMRAYDPTWGQFRAHTIPAIGNHEYSTGNAAGYFSYFGPAAGDPDQGYYSLNLGAWHVIVLNSECGQISGGCGAGSPEETWLRNDLASDTATCTLAAWHEPLYTSVASSTGVAPATDMQPIFADLYNAHVALVLNGHAHNYERFAPQNANGQAAANGVTEIIVGTGGDSHMPFGTIAANSVARNDTAFGVLEVTLNATSFSWQFLPVAGQTFSDSGTQNCP